MPLSHLEKMKVSARHTVICLGASLVYCIPFCGRDCEYRENELFCLDGRAEEHGPGPCNQETMQTLCSINKSKDIGQVLRTLYCSI